MENLGVNSTNSFWHNKRVLLTGHTGFKGGWMAIWLRRLGAKVTGIALEPSTNPNLYTLSKIADGMDSHFCDIRDVLNLKKIIQISQPEILFHFAAQPLVRASYLDPLTTHTTNIIGTANILDTLRTLDSIKVAVIITTDKVYHNNERLQPYCETDQLGGHDPYSSSKAASEIIISSYRDAYLEAKGVAVASARAGNVVGGGDWSIDRLIPDAIKAWQARQPLRIRHPEAIRPWQHVLEPLKGYMTLATHLWNNPKLAGAYNFGPFTSDAASVRDVIEQAKSSFTNAEVIYQHQTSGPHEANLLTLDTTKAQNVLGFKPRWNLVETINRTMAWYTSLIYEGISANQLCEADINAYEDKN